GSGADTVALDALAPGMTLPDPVGSYVRGHAVDARDPDHPVVPLVDVALALGARPVDTGPGDVEVGGRRVWLDGGPVTPFDPVETGDAGVLPAVHLTAGSLQPLQVRSPAADLAPDQLAAVSHRGGPARIIAPAGSGKTRVLTERARHLVRDQGLDPGVVCLVAFNVRARDEMAERTRDCPGLGVRTLNSLSLAIASGTGPFATPPTGPVRTIEERQVRERLARLVPSRRRVAMSDPFAAWIDALRSCRLGLRSPDDVEADFGGEVRELGEVLAAYRAGLRADGVVDFDEQVIRAIEVLVTDPDCRAAARRACGVLLVDEFQDLTPAHLLLIRLLAGPAGEVFAVGDDDQTIYGYTGASPEWLIDFDRWFPGATGHALHVNYRCPAPIVAAANRLLARNRRRLPKRIEPAPRPSSDGVGEPHESVGSLVVSTTADPVGDLVARVRDLLEDGVAPDEVAVLTRVNATLLAPYLALDAAGVPTDTPLGPEFLRRTGVEAARAWLYLAFGNDGYLDPGALGIAVRRPPRGLHPRLVDWVCENTSLAALERLADRLREPRDAERVR
ncbi:MAG: ATP-dependent helicase, partial [Actinomyces sp.]